MSQVTLNQGSFYTTYFCSIENNLLFLETERQPWFSFLSFYCLATKYKKGKSVSSFFLAAKNSFCFGGFFSFVPPTFSFLVPICLCPDRFFQSLFSFFPLKVSLHVKFRSPNVTVFNFLFKKRPIKSAIIFIKVNKTRQIKVNLEARLKHSNF